jgi:DNA-binding response OmpR family regulator/prefoldin subunit 5
MSNNLNGAKQTNPDRDPAADNSQAEILITGTDNDISDIIAGYLSDSEYEVTLAGESDDGSNQTRPDSTYDLIIINITPSSIQDGKVAIDREIENRDIPALAVSNPTISKTQLEQTGANIVGWLTKPFHRAELTERVAEAIEMDPERDSIFDSGLSAPNDSDQAIGRKSRETDFTANNDSRVGADEIHTELRPSDKSSNKVDVDDTTQDEMRRVNTGEESVPQSVHPDENRDKELRRDAADITDQLSSFSEELTDLNDQLNALDNRVSQLRQRTDPIETNVSENKSRIESITDDVDTLADEQLRLAENLNSRIDDVERRIESLESKIDENKERMNSIAEGVDTIANEQLRLEDKIETASNERAELRSATNELIEWKKGVSNAFELLQGNK